MSPVSSVWKAPDEDENLSQEEERERCFGVFSASTWPRLLFGKVCDT